MPSSTSQLPEWEQVLRSAAHLPIAEPSLIRYFRVGLRESDCAGIQIRSRLNGSAHGCVGGRIRFTAFRHIAAKEFL